MNESKTGMKLVFIVVLLLIILPLAIFALLRCFPPVPGESAASGVSSAEEAEPGRITARGRRARHENRAVRIETTTMEQEEPSPVFEAVGAIDPNATHFKKATPYAPGTVPGDSGVVVHAVGSPDDGVSGPQPIPPDDPWGGAVQLPIPQGNR